LEVDGNPGIPYLRAAGFERARGEIVAFIGEHYVADARWCDAILEAFDREVDGVGGPVEMLCPPVLTNWAGYLCEYSALMLPGERSPTEGIAGNNCAYRRTTLSSRNCETLRTNWEFFVQQDLRARGAQLYFEPSMVVSLKRDFSLGRFLSIRFNFSRSFAAMRRARVGTKAVLYTLLTPALVPLMFWRVAKPIFRKRRYIREFAIAAPLVALICLSAALGEAAGYVLGSGQSLGGVE
jgi:hypothetical protein